MSKLKQATKTNQQLKFFGRKMFHSTYSKVKPRVMFTLRNKEDEQRKKYRERIERDAEIFGGYYVSKNNGLDEGINGYFIGYR